jgi:membrane protease YdiL (CAAX protease family)
VEAIATKPPGPDRGRLPQVPWELRRVVWGVVAGLILANFFAPLLALPFDPTLETVGGKLAAQGLFAATLLLVPLGIASEWRISDLGQGFSRLGLRSFAPSALGTMVLTLLAYYGVAVLLTLLFKPDQEDIADELGACDTSVVVVVLAVALIVFGAAFAEEVFFRGFFFSGLRVRYSLWPAALISGGLFGLMHAPTGPLAAIPLAVLGVALAWLYERTGSLWLCVIAHAINNSLALTALC